MEFTLKIEAPELASAVNNLAAALNNYATATVNRAAATASLAEPLRNLGSGATPTAPKKTAKPETAPAPAPAPAADATMSLTAMRNDCVELMKVIVEDPARRKALKAVMVKLGAPNVQAVTDEQLLEFYEAVKAI